MENEEGGRSTVFSNIGNNCPCPLFILAQTYPQLLPDCSSLGTSNEQGDFIMKTQTILIPLILIGTL